MSDRNSPATQSNGDQHTVNAPVLHVVFDPIRFAVAVSGSAPNLEFAKAMLLLAVDATEKQIRERDTRNALSLAGPELLDSLTRGK